jgi:deoxyribose-phosphate aldolase
MGTREDLIEAITQKVLTELKAGHGDDQCEECQGSCAAHCSDKVQAMVHEGACRVSFDGSGAEVPQELAVFIDHTKLGPDTTPQDIDRLCDEARDYGFAAVCVNPVWVKRCAQRLRGTEVRVASVVGFPLGANAPEVKALEARRALRDGAREIDMVLNIGALKGGDYELVEHDIAKVVDACREVGAVCKVILETGLLTDEEKVIACRLAQSAKADFVKTSTGMGHGGATVYDVALMREAIGPVMGVKASGGIHTSGEARQMIEAGATRIGASAGIAIVSNGEGEKSGQY